MKLSNPLKRSYSSDRRTQGAAATKEAVLMAARDLFSQHGIDRVTVAQVGERAGVAASTVYALFKSKEGILRELMQMALFGSKFRTAQSLLDGVTDPVRRLELTAHIARAIYESESEELGLLRGASGFSPVMKNLEEEFESMRLNMQEERLRKLRAAKRLKATLTFKEAQRLMWMYTSRDVYRMLVQQGGWTPERYQAWLADTLVAELVRR